MKAYFTSKWQKKKHFNMPFAYQVVIVNMFASNVLIQQILVISLDSSFSHCQIYYSLSFQLFDLPGSGEYLPDPDLTDVMSSLDPS